VNPTAMGIPILIHTSNLGDSDVSIQLFHFQDNEMKQKKSAEVTELTEIANL